MTFVPLTAREIYPLLADAGPPRPGPSRFRDIDVLFNAVRIAFAESCNGRFYRANRKGYVEAASGFLVCDAGLVNVNTQTDGSVDHGFMQINDVHRPFLEGKGVDWSQILDPRTNARAAYLLFEASEEQKKDGFDTWTSYHRILDGESDPMYQAYWPQALNGLEGYFCDRLRRPYEGYARNLPQADVG